MSKIVIHGGRPLNGSVSVQGAKNSVLPILAATILSGKESVIEGCPDLNDVNYSVQILKYLGCKVKKEGSTITVDSSTLKNSSIPDELMCKMRSSITFLGPITARCGKAYMCSPGGCELGPRPIDLHIKALGKMGAEVKEYGGHVETAAPGLVGRDLHLDFPSVGATENIMMAATLARGTTIITNAAKEPEIIDLQNFLVKMGAKIRGAGSDVIVIEGPAALLPVTHRIIPDRIVAATYLCAAAMTGGKAELKNVKPGHIRAVLSALKDAGAAVISRKNSLLVTAGSRLLPIDILRTLPYPGFPTDAQALLTAMLSVADGTSIVVESIFENRFRHCPELCKMGANIKAHGNVAVIKGVKNLVGAEVTAAELRGGAALTVAGVAAKDTTIVHGTEYIHRGYSDIVGDLRCLGADITEEW